MLRSAAKRLAIQSSLSAINLLQLPRLFPASSGRGVIFTLHHVRPHAPKPFEPNAHLSITPQFLDESIMVIKDLGLVPVPLEQLPALLADESDTRRFVCYTLDDGYRDNLAFAAPVFQKHNVPYTVFVTPGFVDRQRTIWWETAEKLVNDHDSFLFDFGTGPQFVACAGVDAKICAFDRIARHIETASEDVALAGVDETARGLGIDPMKIVDQEIMTRAELAILLDDPLASLGAHTMTHPNLSRVCAERLEEELRKSAHAVGVYAGRPVLTFSYPYGGRNAVSARETKAAKDSGFSLAVTTQPGVLTRESMTHATAVSRVPLNGYYQHPSYVRALVSGWPFRFTPGPKTVG